MKNYWKLKSSSTSIFTIIFVAIATLSLQAQEKTYHFPVRPGQQNYLSGTMGELRGSHFHGGMDIKTGGAMGLKIYAAADGFVSRIRVDGFGYGNALYIEHPQLGTMTVYGHLKEFDEKIAAYVLKEQYRLKKFSVNLFPDKEMFKVKKGDVVALSGNSGSSGGPHLHFEIRDGLQRPMNPLDYGFSEIKDNIAPTLQKIGLKSMDKNARVDDQFGFFQYTPFKHGNEYSLDRTLNVYGNIGLSFMGYDQLNGASNRNGIPHIQMELDGKQVMEININKIPFSENRNILCYRDYQVKAQENRSFQKLYIDDGNELDIYKTDHKKGVISIADTLVHDLKITLKDAYGNTSTIKMKLQGKKPVSTAISSPNKFKPFRHHVVDNTLIFMDKKAEHNGFFAHVHANRMNYDLAPSYYVNNYSVYLWDLRTGIPDSISLCDEQIFPDIQMTVPSGADFKYYTPEMDIHFYSKTLFDTLYLRTDYIDELSTEKEYFEISEDIFPLRKNMTIIMKPNLTYANKSKVSAYYTTDLKNFTYQGGSWKNDAFELTSNTLGKYTLLSDTIPPHIRVSQQNRDKFSCYITDEMSGIKDYELTVNGQWVLMNYDPKRNHIWAEKLDNSVPFEGELVLKVRDQVDNETIYSTTIKQ